MPEALEEDSAEGSEEDSAVDSEEGSAEVKVDFLEAVPEVAEALGL